MTLENMNRLELYKPMKLLNGVLYSPLLLLSNGYVMDGYYPKMNKNKKITIDKFEENVLYCYGTQRIFFKDAGQNYKFNTKYMNRHRLYDTIFKCQQKGMTIKQIFEMILF